VLKQGLQGHAQIVVETLVLTFSVIGRQQRQLLLP
jgi:hypothetical protein